MTRPYNSADTFAAVWNAAGCREEVRRKLGYATRNAVNVNAHRLRAMGYRLKRFLVLRPRVSRARFMEEWNNAASCREVADRLGMNARYVHVRASRLRKIGVRLKHLRPSGSAKYFA